MATNSAYTSAGSKIYITSGLPATEDQAGYEALSYDEIGEVVSIAEYGPSSGVINHNKLSTQIIEKFKGSRDFGNFAIGVGRAPGDAGQSTCVAAEQSNNRYSFKVTHGDTGGSTPTTEYYQAIVSTFTTNIGSAEQVTAANINIAITTRIIEIAST
jgi:hypothetical protein